MSMKIDRRRFVSSATVTGSMAAAFGLGLGGLGLASPLRGAAAHPLPNFFPALEHRPFRFFWERANPANGMMPDRWPTPSFASIAAIGFALTAYPIGVARVWVRGADARPRTLTAMRFL